jgi:hypothetical protein
MGVPISHYFWTGLKSANHVRLNLANVWIGKGHANCSSWCQNFGIQILCLVRHLWRILSQIDQRWHKVKHLQDCAIERNESIAGRWTRWVHSSCPIQSTNIRLALRIGDISEVGQFATLLKIVSTIKGIQCFLIMWCSIRHPSSSPKTVSWSSLWAYCSVPFPKFQRTSAISQRMIVARRSLLAVKDVLQGFSFK